MAKIFLKDSDKKPKKYNRVRSEQKESADRKAYNIFLVGPIL